MAFRLYCERTSFAYKGLLFTGGLVFSIILICFFACYVQAADDDWCGANMKVIFRTTISGAWEAAINGKALCIESSVGHQTVYDVAAEQILQGFCFLPGVTQQERYNPELHKPHLRELICQKTPFLSEELMRCLEKIEEVLPENKDAAASHILCKKPKKYIAKKTLCPEGKTRAWSVIPLQDVTKVSFANRVYLVFCDKSEALLGELCSKDTKISSAKTLLYFHQSSTVYSLPRTPADSVPTPEELLSLGCGSQYNLGLICFPRDGERCAALMNASLLSLTRQYTWKGKHHTDRKTAIDLLKGEILSGYFLRNHKKIKNDIAVLRQPQVRECFCDRFMFTNRVLDSFVRNVGKFLKDNEMTFQGKHDLWCGLQEEHCKNLCPRFKKFEWGVLPSKAFQGHWGKGTARAGIVLILLQGETVVLKGRPVDHDSLIFSSQTSLFDRLCKHIVKHKAEEKDDFDETTAL